MIVDNIVQKGYPLTFAEISQLLGTRQDEGTFCKDTGINMWSKYKPFINPKPVFLQDTGNGNDRDEALKAANYGIDIWGSTDLADVVNKYKTLNNPSNGWHYDNVLANYPNACARISDFFLYNHRAQCQFVRMTTNASGDIRQIYRKNKLSVSVIAVDGGSYSLKMSDFPAIRDGYYGLVIYNNTKLSDTDDRRKFYAFFKDKQVKDTDGNFSINVSAEAFTADDTTTESCSIFPVIKVEAGSGETTTKDMYYTLPNIEMETFKVIKTSTADLTLEVVKYTKDSKYYVKINYIKARSQYATTLTGLKVYLRFANKLFDDTKVSGEQKIEFSDTNIRACSATEYIPISISDNDVKEVSESLYNNLLVWIDGTLNDQRITRSYSALMVQYGATVDENNYDKPEQMKPGVESGMSFPND